MLLTYPKGSNDRLSTHFAVSEFACPCPQCTETKIDSDLIDKLQAFRHKAGPLRVNSGYRCPAYQDELRARGYETSAGPSQHTLGRAADVMRADEGSIGLDLEACARASGFSSVGVGHSWVHVDLRPGYRRWEYVRR